MKYDCLIIDDEIELANNTCEYLNLYEVKTFACQSKKAREEFFKENDTSLILDASKDKELSDFLNNEIGWCLAKIDSYMLDSYFFSTIYFFDN